MDRRRFIKIASSSLLAGALPVPAAWAQAPVRQRLDIETFSKDPALVAALRKAFEVLRSRPNSTLVGAFNYAAIHSIRSTDPDGASAPAAQRSYWNQCHKDENLFFIWHRAYLAALERNLQLLSGRNDLGLPYWDWYRNPSLPQIFRDEFVDAARTQKNWLYDARRDPAVQGGTAVWTPYSSVGPGQTDFGRFQDLLNYNEHGDIHLGVGGRVSGGDMASIQTAARDPIFWLHHCNLDRLLAAWVSKGRTVTNQSSAFDSKYKFPIESAPDLIPVASGMDMAKTTPLGVAYESLQAPFAIPPRPAVRPPATVTRGASPRALGTATLSLSTPAAVAVPATGLNIDFTTPKPGDKSVMNVLNVSSVEAATSVTVVLEGVRIDNPPRGLAGFDVLVNLPAGTTQNAGRLKIGSIPIFSLTAEHPDGMSMAPTFRFGALPTLKANGGIGPGVSVSLVPRFAPYGDHNSQAIGIRIDDVRVEVSSAPVM